MKTIEERAFDIISEVMTMDDLYSRDVVVMMLERMAEEQQAIDDAELHQRFEKVLNGQKWYLIETIPQLYVRWLMIEGDKPTWEEYANKSMED